MINAKSYLLLISILIFLACSKDDNNSPGETPPPAFDLKGNWEIPDLGTFLIDQGSSPNIDAIKSFAMEYNSSLCFLDSLKHNFSLIAFAEVKVNKIENAMAGDINHYGFNDDDLKRIDFSCDFTSSSDATGTITISLRESFGTSNWCEKTFNFSAKKK